MKGAFSWKTKDVIIDLCYDVGFANEVFIDAKIISDYNLTNSFWGKHPLYTDAIKFGIYAG